MSCSCGQAIDCVCVCVYIHDGERVITCTHEFTHALRLVNVLTHMNCQHVVAGSKVKSNHDVMVKFT